MVKIFKPLLIFSATVSALDNLAGGVKNDVLRPLESHNELNNDALENESKVLEIENNLAGISDKNLVRPLGSENQISWGAPFRKKRYRWGNKCHRFRRRYAVNAVGIVNSASAVDAVTNVDYAGRSTD
ncbi:hypothetical protein AYI70_g5502 [Smittium culicis]|uniref:Uncharacterized protein n=1 Tax=Smittium culicis TaxID=133412 RepID=A0A1R1XU62_9FUNG|nr:hypothetical protein AYI70_g5502 [Smittium culicis]